MDKHCKPTKRQCHQPGDRDQAQGQHQGTCTSRTSKLTSFILLQNIYIQTSASFNSWLRGSN